MHFGPILQVHYITWALIYGLIRKMKCIYAIRFSDTLCLIAHLPVANCECSLERHTPNPQLENALHKHNAPENLIALTCIFTFYLSNEITFI